MVRAEEVPRPPSCSVCKVSKVERDRLLRETRGDTSSTERELIRILPKPDRLNNLILRGAILHADAEMFFPRRSSAREAPIPAVNYFSAPTRFRNFLRAPAEIMRSVDGQYVGSETGAPHWFMARALLQFITPEPALDANTRRWYLAVTAFLAARADFANLLPHLDATEALFPDDAVMAFDRGWQSEAHATPLMQAHARALTQAVEERSNRTSAFLCRVTAMYCDSEGNPYGVKNERASLVDAERHFARAIKLDPGMTEAHIRLAHVRTLLGRAAEAEAALRDLPPSNDEVLTFYAALVHGNALDALNRLDEAAAAYQRALTLFPDAGSANLAMSVVQQKRGDTSSSIAFAKRATQWADRARNVDPFSRYRTGRGRALNEAWDAFYREAERTATP
jgi:tetratricopeptide (TPR) repeat protein